MEHPVDEMRLCVQWYGYQNESLSYGLRTAEDALKLYRAMSARDEYADVASAYRLRKILGYDPLKGSR